MYRSRVQAAFVLAVGITACVPAGSSPGGPNPAKDLTATPGAAGIADRPARILHDGGLIPLVIRGSFLGDRSGGFQMTGGTAAGYRVQTEISPDGDCQSPFDEVVFKPVSNVQFRNDVDDGDLSKVHEWTFEEPGASGSVKVQNVLRGFLPAICTTGYTSPGGTTIPPSCTPVCGMIDLWVRRQIAQGERQPGDPQKSDTFVSETIEIKKHPTEFRGVFEVHRAGRTRNLEFHPDRETSVSKAATFSSLGRTSKPFEIKREAWDFTDEPMAAAEPAKVRDEYLFADGTRFVQTQHLDLNTGGMAATVSVRPAGESEVVVTTSRTVAASGKEAQTVTAFGVEGVTYTIAVDYDLRIVPLRSNQEGEVRLWVFRSGTVSSDGRQLARLKVRDDNTLELEIDGYTDSRPIALDGN